MTLLLGIGLGLSLPLSSVTAAVTPSSAPTAYPTSYAIIGALALPGGGFAENPYVSADDTVYVPTGNPNYVAVIAPGKTGGTLDDSIPALYPRAVTVSKDDTVFIAEYLAQRVTAYAPGSKTASYAIPTTHYPHGLGINSDDTLLIASYFGGSGQGSVDLVSRNASTPTATLTSIFSPSNPTRVAVDSRGDFYVGSDGTSVKVIPRNALTVSTTISGLSSPEQPGILPDDTLVVSNRGTNSVGVVPLGSTTPSGSVTVGSTPVALAVDSLGYVYTSNYSSNSISKVDPISRTAETIVTGASSTHGVVVTSTGLVYFTTNNPGMGVSVAAELSASTTPVSGAAGSSLTLALTGLPAGVLVDDSTVTAVWMGDDTIAYSRNAGQNRLTVTVPPGVGTVPLVVELRGGRPISAGSFTYATAPPVVEPPTAPSEVVATAGDASAIVTWSTPSSSGSFAISNYQVRATPGGRTCITTGLTCSVDGLTNGTAYSFDVRALNGAGWGPWSVPSDSITPRTPVSPSVVITGSREEVRGKPGIVISGRALGLGMGAILRPWMRFPGRVDFTQGSADILVSTTGDFTWERRTGKRVTVFVQTPDGDVTSNRVTIR